MKIAKVSLLALSIMAAGSVFAQVPGPNPDTLVACNNVIYDCENRGKALEESKVDHKLSKTSYKREIFAVKSREKMIYIVKEEVLKPLPVDSYFQVEPQGVGNPWAYVPK